MRIFIILFDKVVCLDFFRTLTVCSKDTTKILVNVNEPLKSELRKSQLYSVYR